jgi:hypothetical protein
MKEEPQKKLTFADVVDIGKTLAAIDIAGNAMSSANVSIIEAIVAYMVLIVQDIKKDEDIETFVDLLRLIHDSNKSANENDSPLL